MVLLVRDASRMAVYPEKSSRHHRGALFALLNWLVLHSSVGASTCQQDGF
jgi:hypothetical protein